MSADRVGLARKPGKPKKAVKSLARPLRDAVATPHRTCPYTDQGEACGVPVSKNEEFCIHHSSPAPMVGEKVERLALGDEAAQRLREELGVDQQLRDASEKAAVEPLDTGEVERAIAAKVREAMGVAPLPTPSPRTQPPPDDTAKVHQIAVEMVRKEREAMAERAAGRQKKGSQNISATSSMAMNLAPHFPEMRDESAMVDSNGKSLLKPGYKGRWVRTVNDAGKPSNRRLNVYKHQLGAIEVLDENGTPLVGDLGVAIQAPYDRWAAWAIKNSQAGAFDSAAQQAEMAYDSVERANRSVGRGVAQMIPREEHGSRELF